MKQISQPPAQQKTIAIGFTVAVHTVAVLALLYLGLSEPPAPPKQLKTVLVKPEELPPPEPPEQTEENETVHQNIAQEIQQTADPVEAAPVIPVTAAPVKTEAVPVKAEVPPSPVETALAKQNAENAARRAEAQQRAETEAKLKAELAAKQQAAADAKAKATADAKAKAEADARAKAAADAKAKAVADAKAKAVADAKAKAVADAKVKAAADAKAKAAADAKAKAEADARAKAAAEAREQAEQEAKASAAKKASEEAAQKKADAKRIASTAKRDFTNKIQRAWDVPAGSIGKQATARVTLSDSGAVLSVVVNASDPDMKASVEAAVRAAAPYPMPSDPDARREARSFSSTFTAR